MVDLMVVGGFGALGFFGGWWLVVWLAGFLRFTLD
jgi:hypothetical protein